MTYTIQIIDSWADTDGSYGVDINGEFPFTKDGLKKAARDKEGLCRWCQKFNGLPSHTAKSRLLDADGNVVCWWTGDAFDPLEDWYHDRYERKTHAESFENALRNLEAVHKGNEWKNRLVF